MSRQVVDGRLQDRYIIPKETESRIARSAEKAADRADPDVLTSVIVVDVPPFDPRVIRATDGAPATLRREHPLEVGLDHAVSAE